MSAAKRRGTKRVPSRGNLAGKAASTTGSVNRGVRDSYGQGVLSGHGDG